MSFSEITQKPARSAAGRAARALAWGLLAVYFAFVALVLLLRYAILPNVELHRPAIERLIGEAIGQKVSIGRVEASWEGINPDLTLHDVRVAEAGGRPAFAFERVETVFSWWSVPAMRPRLRVLRIDAPTLHMRRAADGRIFAGGIEIGAAAPGESDSAPSIPAWALEQRRVRVANATLVWEDEARRAPPLTLEDVDIAIDNDGRRHRFGLTARPPGDIASRVDVRGDFRGGRFDPPAKWRGQAFIEIGYADLAAWKRWIDFPVVLPRGRAAARVWLSLAGGDLREATADLALADVELGLAENRPALLVENFSGRLRASFMTGGVAVKGNRAALAFRAPGGDGARIEETDFDFEWRRDSRSGEISARLDASRLDLGAAARLAAFLPLDAALRRWLDCAPRGRIDALAGRWSGRAERTRVYALKGRAQELGLRACGALPGFSGLTGEFEANEAGGRAEVRAGASTIELPKVFEETPIKLDSLNALATWKIERGALEVDLARADFAGPDAAGAARGSYRRAGAGPGSIDMTAELTRAEARAVWRYLPLVVGRGARHWLRDSLLAGKATEARLVLKGDIGNFPFLDKRQGQFLVTVKARDAVLDYAKGWPRIEGIEGNLRFEGNGMTIDARRGRILGARLTNTQVRIPDFDAPISTLYVKGQADGPTAEFLKFIDKRPVAEKIDHFTEGMTAAGAGRLDLDLTIPLDEATLGESKVAGAFRLSGNEVTVDEALPPLRNVGGSLRFTGDSLTVPEIDATLFGGPLKIRGGTQKDGRVLMTADGAADAAG
ncbi:MAG: TIGR02099 family protein, partial [Candidatus Accumulibacter sp.]|nr:TIGR02099 family protein [Accumulibacter sp.]